MHGNSSLAKLLLDDPRVHVPADLLRTAIIDVGWKLAAKASSPCTSYARAYPFPTTPSHHVSSSQAFEIRYHAATRRWELLELLLSHPRVDPLALDERGQTFLFYTACSRGVYHIIYRLLHRAQELGVQVNHQVCRMLLRCLLLQFTCECPNKALACAHAADFPCRMLPAIQFCMN